MVHPTLWGNISVKSEEGDIIASLTTVAPGTVLIIQVVPDAAYDYMTTIVNDETTSHNPCKYIVQEGDLIVDISAEFCIKRSPCFLDDAPVLTPYGYRPIVSLQIGDLVTTGSGGVSRIRAIKTQRTTPYAFSHPYVIPIGLYGAWTRLLISPHHRVKVAINSYLEARFLGLQREIMMERFSYYNLELEDPYEDIIVAGVTVEPWKERDIYS